MNVVAQQEACNTGEVAKSSPIPIQEAAPVQQMLLDLTFSMAIFIAAFSKSSYDTLQKKRLHDLPTGQLYQFIWYEVVPRLQTLLPTVSPYIAQGT